jgi:uncharacterized protein
MLLAAVWQSAPAERGHFRCRNSLLAPSRTGASLYVYGSVATGTVRPGSSDVDLLSIDLPDAAVLGRRLPAR